MKLCHLLYIFFLSGANSHAALYTLSNGNGSTAAGVQTTSGKTFRNGTIDGESFTGSNGGISGGSGIVSFGFFSTDDFSAITTPSALVALFTRFGSEGTFAAAGVGGNRSVFASEQTQSIAPAFSNKNIYLFVGNGSTYLSSTEFLVVKMATEIFVPGDDITYGITPKEIVINPSNSTSLIGSEITNVYTTNSDSSATGGWQMATLVPEPSSALLAGLGTIALFRRRRIY